MAPRIQNPIGSNSLLPYLSSSSTSSSFTPLSSRSQRSCRSFSSTIVPQTRLRNQMFLWLQHQAAELKHHKPGSTNYLSQIIPGSLFPESRPFPQNIHYRSESILSEELRREIHHRVVVRKKSVRAVSVELKVDMRRVAAVVRLVELEKRMTQEGKPLALPYARAIHEMVPTTPLYDQELRAHEEINDLPVHRLTNPQIFYPVSESRQFNRVDAGRVFSAAPALEQEQAAKDAADDSEFISRITQNPSHIEVVGKGEDEHQVLQPADVRIPHPHMISSRRAQNLVPQERTEHPKIYRAHLQKAEEAEQERKRRSEERKGKQTQRVQPEDSRFEFRINDVVVSQETTGKDGRNARAPGRRYGVPSYDRKKGQVKIPTRVEV
ncbi:mitochondrial 37S ribosomal protein mS45 [Aspergillus ibericus CBS 121593]|uniref:Eukaryotic mitochondrial regulator protein-domain-containing protein n=1 Tax=Aspergillus ibericus CBS 121593 TaxID=1448316 RepID=A0A395H2U5_9EURO|nr:hypothetical protein BO80DRAFT_423993 [Aspergillus ibericus CBS 121593]RAL02076.1 hypothetical protein BO80DRAFT_423993 [Aspergillus ibericus CBS 121593]